MGILGGQRKVTDLQAYGIDGLGNQGLGFLFSGTFWFGGSALSGVGLGVRLWA